MPDEVQKQPTRRVTRPWYAPWRSEAVISDVIDLRHTSVTAAAARLTGERIKSGTHRKTESWMTEAWLMFDLVGELHFVATTLARRASQARFYVGKVEGSDVVELEEPVDKPEEGAEPIDPAVAREEKIVRDVFAALGDGFIGVQEVVERFFLNNFVVGACYLAGAPAETWAGRPQQDVKNVPLEKIIWRTLSLRELVVGGDGSYDLKQNGSSTRIRSSQMFVVTLWSPHPADATVPDSPVRAALPILREVVGLTQHVSAQIDSRLAGAGMLINRSSTSKAIKKSMGLSEDDPSDPFTEQLIDAMVTPIGDRDSASAVVPFVVTIPDDTTAPEYISFTSSLDQFAVELREEAIRRIALALDAPPELLLGQGSTNHWTAWLTQEEVVDSHIAPPLATFARGITTEYLRTVLRANGFDEERAEKYAIWFDVSGLTVKANIAADAQALFALGLVSEETVRRAAGFDESDAPQDADVREQAIDMVKAMVESNPGLMNRPGLDVLVEQITALLEGKPMPGISNSRPSATPGAPGSPAVATSPATTADAAPNEEAPATRPGTATVSPPMGGAPAGGPPMSDVSGEGKFGTWS